MSQPFAVIVTHPGSAHKDEFLACCVLLATRPAPVFRREVTAVDLADPSICVVDVGHRHEPALNNFDHHQFPREATPTCSLSLVLQNLGLYEDAREFCEWLEVAEWFDCRGPISTAKWLGVERELLNRLNSPADISLLKRFSRGESFAQGEPLWEVMRMIGEDLLEYLQSLHERLEYLGTHSELWQLELADGPAEILFLPRTEPLPQEPNFGIERYVDHAGLSGRVVGVVCPDSRGTGYGLSRFRDNPRLDFLRVAQDPRVHFVHARGFLAKTASTEPAVLRELLLMASRGA